MIRSAVTRRLSAILAADVVAYSRLMGADEAGTLARLTAVRSDLIQPMPADHHGRVVKTTGDGILIEFRSVVDAVACAAEMQQLMSERNAGEAPERRIEFRVGINIGDVIVEGCDIYGDGVKASGRSATAGAIRSGPDGGSEAGRGCDGHRAARRADARESRRRRRAGKEGPGHERTVCALSEPRRQGRVRDRRRLGNRRGHRRAFLCAARARHLRRHRR